MVSQGAMYVRCSSATPSLTGCSRKTSVVVTISVTSARFKASTAASAAAAGL
jgi:hypothetical protein